MEKEDETRKLNFLDVTIITTAQGNMSLKYIEKMQS